MSVGGDNDKKRLRLSLSVSPWSQACSPFSQLHTIPNPNGDGTFIQSIIPGRGLHSSTFQLNLSRF